MSPALANAVLAMPTEGLFLGDYAAAVANDACAATGAAEMLGRIASLRGNIGPISAFDFAIRDIEAIDAAWPLVHAAVNLHRANPSVAPALARFIFDRLPSIWANPQSYGYARVTLALRLADVTDTLVGFFMIGLRPNGSKDPFALRRAAKFWLIDAITAHRAKSLGLTA